ncbi:hypothetical protein CPB83DRAFT_910623, partial [Crepidotus variabilis]
MTLCPHCRLVLDTTSWLRDGTTESCLKNHGSACLACPKLLKIEQNIEETRRTLEQLLSEREELVSVLNQHHDPFLNQLPVEIVSHIFALSKSYLPSPDISDLGLNAKMNVQEALHPGQVCHNWRDIAHHTSALWSIFATTIIPKNYETSLEISLEWLSKSGGLPLFIQLYAKEPSDGAVSPFTHDFLESIAQHTYRWKVLELQFPMNMVPVFSTATAGKKMDQLEQISLNIQLDHLNGP